MVVKFEEMLMGFLVAVRITGRAPLAWHRCLSLGLDKKGSSWRA